MSQLYLVFLKYSLNLHLEQGASDITLKDVTVGTQVNTDFKITKTLEQQLQMEANELLKAYYSKKNMSKFLSSDSDVETTLKPSENNSNVVGPSKYIKQIIF